MLEQAGFRILTARDGCDAVETFRAHADNIRAVLLDLTMPCLDGIEVRRRIREIRPEVPILLSSGYGPDEAALRQGSDGPGAFIEKPYRLRDLRERFRALLGESLAPDPALPPDPGS
jgi:DNA-binding response OmpR family regulator